MKVYVDKTVREAVTLSEYNQREVTVAYLRERFGLPEGSYVSAEGILMYSEEQYGGSHSWFDEKKVRPATDLDRQALAVINAVKERKL